MVKTDKEFIELLLKYFFKHQLQIKMYHFQTKKYGAHKTSDKYLEKFEDKLDKFMETAQGIVGKFDTKNIDININTFDDHTIYSGLEDFANILLNLDKRLSQFPQLINIRDSMLANVNQYKYLLTFH